MRPSNSAQLPAPIAPDPTPAARPEAANSAASLLDAMRRGDRDAASRFVAEFGELIRRRVRGKLGTGMRRIFDSQEILSTVGRRLDRFILEGQLRATTEPELWSLLFRMVDGALVDKARAYRRLRRVESEDSDFAATLMQRMNTRDEQSPEGGEIELEAAFRALKSDVDREVLAMWLNDVPHRRIAEEIRSTPEAVRQRWHSIKEHLRNQVLSGAL